MFRFVHIGDIHLGYRQYKLSERENDYFQAFLDICSGDFLQANQIDFMVISGDLFDMRSISADVYNQAVYALRQAKEYGIPVIAIEGNHDLKEAQHYSSSPGSWYEALAQNSLMTFLYPSASESGDLELLPLASDKFQGGAYIDLVIRQHKVRIIGSRWYGMKANNVIPLYAEKIKDLPDRADFSIFLFHGGYEDVLPLNMGGISLASFEALGKEVDYIGLGHIHQYYTVKGSKEQDYVFNPGSLEAHSTLEATFERGALITEVNDNNQISSTTLYKKYHQRQFISVPELKLSEYRDIESVLDDIVRSKIPAVSESIEGAILIITLSGGAVELDERELVRQIESTVRAQGALHCIIKKQNKTTKSLSILQDKQTSSRGRSDLDLEKKIFTEIIQSDEGIPQEKSEQFIKQMINIKANFSKEVQPEELLDYLVEKE